MFIQNTHKIVTMMKWHNHIHSNSAVLLGKPIIKGTRISVELIVELFALGWTQTQILESYPRISEQDIQAVFFYLSDCLKEELYFPIPQMVQV